MKLYSLFEQEDVENVEFNHRKFCDANGIEYNKIFVKNVAHKYYLIFDILQKNIGESIIFIDSYSFFKKFNYKFNLDKDIAIQVSQRNESIKIYDNFFIVKSNLNTLKIFKNILNKINQDVCHNVLPIVPNFPKEYHLQYPYVENNLFFNANAIAHEGCLVDPTNFLVINLNFSNKLFFNQTPANILSSYVPQKYDFISDKFSTYNLGKKKAIVTIYTDNIKNYGIISETNITRYCIENDITFYVYREIPDDLKRMVGSWCKPYLLLRHMEEHEHISWIDSDIIITNDYKIDWSHDICAYNDPLVWYLNSGYMCFKNNDKNKLLLNNIINKIEKLDKLDSVYVNDGDQKYFINEIVSMYPNFVPLSMELGNSHFNYPRFRRPTEPAMIHFMGVHSHIRVALMDYYEQEIYKDYLKK